MSVREKINSGYYSKTSVTYCRPHENRKQWLQYCNKAEENYNKFKEESLEEVGLSNHPKKEQVFRLAWSEGHSSGHSEVFNWIEELAKLVK